MPKPAALIAVSAAAAVALNLVTLTPFPTNGRLCFNSPLMLKDQRPPPERESVWSVARAWLPWCLALIFLLTFVWTGFVAWVQITTGSHPSVGPLVETIVIKGASGVPLILVISIAAVTIADIAGGAIVVTYRYLNNKFVEPLRRQLREEGKKEGREEGREEGKKEGRKEGVTVGEMQANQRWRDWLRRRDEAQAKGEPFDEPPPDRISPNGKDPAGE